MHAACRRWTARCRDPARAAPIPCADRLCAHRGAASFYLAFRAFPPRRHALWAFVVCVQATRWTWRTTGRVHDMVPVLSHSSRLVLCTATCVKQGGTCAVWRHARCRVGCSRAARARHDDGVGRRTRMAGGRPCLCCYRFAFGDPAAPAVRHSVRRPGRACRPVPLRVRALVRRRPGPCPAPAVVHRLGWPWRSAWPVRRAGRRALRLPVGRPAGALVRRSPLPP